MATTEAENVSKSSGHNGNQETLAVSSKRKAKSQKKNGGSSSPLTFTARTPSWAYLQLELITHTDPSSSTTANPLDELTARTYLTSALSQFLGVTGASIPIDILKVEHQMPTAAGKKQQHDMLWIRVPHDDAGAVTAAVSSWIGGPLNNVAWRVRNKGSFLGAVVPGDGSALFSP